MFVQVLDDGEVEVGGFVVIHTPAVELTPERIAAIKADPKASKIVRSELGCKKCPTKYRAYFGLDRNEKLEAEGWKWAPSIAEDSFTCECGTTTMSLQYLKTGLGAYLGHTPDSGGDVSTISYQRSHLQTIRNNFLKLLDARPAEEAVQQYINTNRALLYQFSPFQVLPKPPIGTLHRADFAILKSNGDLLLVELESPKMQLLQKNGHRTNRLTHALDQVNDWLREIAEHRVAMLHGMGLKSEQVNKVRGVVIAGRDAGHDAGHLRNLRKSPNDGYDFYTYDDLLAGMDTLIKTMSDM